MIFKFITVEKIYNFILVKNEEIGNHLFSAERF